MTNSEFVDFFHKVLNNDVPKADSERIKKHWRRDSALVVTCDKMIADYGHVESAAVIEGIIWNTFCFREFFVKFAPEEIARTVIKHELAHVIIHLESVKFGPDCSAFYSSSPQKSQRFKNEHRASKLNQAWLSNEKDAAQWIKDFSPQTLPNSSHSYL